MRSYQRYVFFFAALAIAAWTAPHAFVFAEDTPPLKLVKTIELTDIRSGEPDVSADQLTKNLTTTRMVGVANHFDHLTPDLKNNRLFVVPEDNKSIEVYNIRTGKFVHSIKGIGVGHSVVYRADIDRIFVTDGSDGDVKIFNGTTYELIKSVKLLADSDATGYDPVTHYLYIADGGLDAKLNYTFLEIVNTDTGEKVGQIKIDSNRLEAMAVEKIRITIIFEYDREKFHRRHRPEKAGGGRGLAAYLQSERVRRNRREKSSPLRRVPRRQHECAGFRHREGTAKSPDFHGR